MDLLPSFRLDCLACRHSAFHQVNATGAGKGFKLVPGIDIPVPGTSVLPSAPASLICSARITTLDLGLGKARLKKQPLHTVGKRFMKKGVLSPNTGSYSFNSMLHILPDAVLSLVVLYLKFDDVIHQGKVNLEGNHVAVGMIFQ